MAEPSSRQAQNSPRQPNQHPNRQNNNPSRGRRQNRRGQGQGGGKQQPRNNIRSRGGEINTNGSRINPEAATRQGPPPVIPGKVRIIPLGGLGEIGKNLMVIEYEKDIIVVDMGMIFPSTDMLGVDYVIPDVTYLEERKDRIRGIVITHAHEDHVGAIPYIWPKLGQVPMFATKLTAGLIDAKLKDRRIKGMPKIGLITPETDLLTLGAFKVEFVRVNHSIPDCIAVLIHTPAGVIMMTGDFKFDTVPFDGVKALEEKMKKFPGGVLALLSDSTNIEVKGHSLSESTLLDAFDQIYKDTPGRLIIASFSSQLNRIQQFMDTAVKRNRKVAITGRSMLNNVTIAAQLGYLRIPAGQIIRVEDTKNYPDDQVLILTTGSQGEEMSALARMASGEHKQVKIKKGDTVVFSASPIPGNEVSVYGVIDDLFREGASVIYDKHMHVHVSGHACYDEQKQMLAMTNPRYFIPVHGEYRMLVHHAELAQSMGIAEDHTFIIDNGEVVEIDVKTTQFAKAKQKVHSGLVLVDGSGIGDVGEIVLRDRKLMSQDGIFVVIMTMEKSSGRLMSSPDIISRGFVYLRENEELIHRARQEVKKALSKKEGTPPPTANYVKNKVRDAVGDLLWAKTKRRPMVLPVLIEV